MNKEQIAFWLQSAVCRRNGVVAAPVSIELDAQGNPTTITGTLTEASKSATPVPMCWNIAGKALSQDAGYDLVTRVKLTEVTPAQ